MRCAPQQQQDVVPTAAATAGCGAQRSCSKDARRGWLPKRNEGGRPAAETLGPHARVASPGAWAAENYQSRVPLNGRAGSRVRAPGEGGEGGEEGG